MRMRGNIISSSYPTCTLATLGHLLGLHCGHGDVNVHPSGSAGPVLAGGAAAAAARVSVGLGAAA